MGMTKTTDAAITDIIEALSAGTWKRISDVAQAAGIAPEEMTEAVKILIEDGGLSAEPMTFRHRITKADARYAVIIGGEARHMIKYSL